MSRDKSNKQGTTFSSRVLDFYKNLKIKERLPEGVEVLNPYQDRIAFGLCERFYQKYYNDNNTRRLIFGINPGRFGGGITGIPFTDPIKLIEKCGIENNMQKKAELSADFIHAMIEAYGGHTKFFFEYYFNSVSPLGFIYHGKNLNYYDTGELQDSLMPFILKSIRQNMSLGIHTNIVYCLGEGDNYKFLKSLNEKEKFFGELVPLAHPRFIMQYKRKSIDRYIDDYLKKLKY